METMSGFMLLTFWLCAGVNYIMLRNMSKRQKGLLLGVTLPPEADALPEVQAIVKQYRTRLGTLCLVCAALSVPLAFVQETAIALTLWMLFFFAGLALPYLPLLRANAKLKALKKKPQPGRMRPLVWWTLPLRPLHCQSPWACGRCCRRWC